MTEAYSDCTGSPPWPEMVRLHAGGPNHYYLYPECGRFREDVYRGGSIVEHCWRDGPNSTLPEAVREEALEILEAPNGEQLELWGE